MNNNVRKAKDLAAKPYVTIVYLNPTTDGEGFVFVATNPEIEGCKAQGLTMEEAQANLDEVRIDMIEHLLNYNLPIPDPAWVATTAGNESIEAENVYREKDLEEPLDLYIEPEYQELLHEALLKVLVAL
jgi:predicted RNase H-like HicB family nuclease